MGKFMLPKLFQRKTNIIYAQKAVFNNKKKYWQN